MVGLPCSNHAAVDELAPAYYTGSRIVRALAY
jgi:hypothetical protein